LDERLKLLMQELGSAINDSLADSDRIASAISDIREAGFDVFLILEATIGFNKRDENAPADEAETGDSSETEIEISDERPRGQRRSDAGIRLKFTNQDQKFLRALKISVEDETSE
jgi:hypothetical protein